ncbi:MAG: glycosyltransferase [Dehalococcoidales bacterium]|jgi:glycosyltransferase involved in cell wall biosynthesis
MPIVSITISTWDRVNDLKVCVDSILNQSYIKNNDRDTWELIIVDNGSKDGTRQYLSELESVIGHNLKYIILSHSNYTAMQTLNFAFKMASGEFVIVLDDDAFIESNDAIESMVEIMNQNFNCAIIGANVQFEKERFDGTLSQMPIRCLDGRFLTTGEILSLSDVIPYYEFHGAFAMFRNEILELVGYYDNDFNIYINEFDLACKVLDRGNDVLFAKNIIAKHKDQSSIKCNKKNINYIINYDTVVTRSFTGIFNRIKVVSIRLPMLYVMHMINMIKYCSKLRIFMFTIQTGVEYFRALFRCVFPDKHYKFRDKKLQEYMQVSLYNSFKKNTTDFIRKIFNDN